MRSFRERAALLAQESGGHVLALGVQQVLNGAMGLAPALDLCATGNDLGRDHSSPAGEHSSFTDRALAGAP